MDNLRTKDVTWWSYLEIGDNALEGTVKAAQQMSSLGIYL